MKFVQRSNEVLRVPDDAVDGYLKKGYDLLDDSGKHVVKKGARESYTPAEYNALLDEIEELKKKLASAKK